MRYFKSSLLLLIAFQGWHIVNQIVYQVIRYRTPFCFANYLQEKVSHDTVSTRPE